MDNLKILKENLDSAININAGVGEILVQDHNDVITEFINKAGKFTGLTYKSIFDAQNGVIPNGTFSWNGNAMNQSGDFVVVLSKKTTDLNDISYIIDNLIYGDILKFKDFVGRSVLLMYKSHYYSNDAIDGEIINIVVNSFIDNTNYTYQPTEVESCIVEFFKISKKTLLVFGNPFQLLKHPRNNDPAKKHILENNDFILNGFRDDSLIWIQAQCLDATNKDLDASWSVLDTIEEINFN